MDLDSDIFKNIYTFKEAATEYGIDSSTLRKAVQSGRFKKGEVKKIGTTWIVTKSAMRRLYGDKEISITDRIINAKREVLNQSKKKDKNKKHVDKDR